MLSLLRKLDSTTNVLIAGPTASGKSGLALEIAEQHGGIVVNADALQVFSNWSVVTARPPAEDLARAAHALYGHVGKNDVYSVGHWQREVADLVQSGERLIITGGTGLYFRALTEGLAQIPQIPPAIRVQADDMRTKGHIQTMIDQLDSETLKRIDTANPMRVQRAWEVQQATGCGLAHWHAKTPAPMMPLKTVETILIDAPKAWLSPRIMQRFDQMLATGALEEAEQNAMDWDPLLPSSKAIGAPELVAFVNGDISKETAKERAVVATQQYAKRQRTWFRARMKNWKTVSGEDL